MRIECPAKGEIELDCQSKCLRSFTFHWRLYVLDEIHVIFATRKNPFQNLERRNSQKSYSGITLEKIIFAIWSDFWVKYSLGKLSLFNSRQKKSQDSNIQKSEEWNKSLNFWSNLDNFWASWNDLEVKYSLEKLSFFNFMTEKKLKL